MNEFKNHALFIKEYLGEELILGQLEEECGELNQVSHKIIRQIQGKNIPNGNKDYTENLHEEIGDVILCAILLDRVDFDEVFNWIEYKAKRWEDRLRNEKENNET